MESLHLNAPLKRVYSKKSKRPTPWISDAILEKIKLKNKVKHSADKSRNPADKEAFRKCKNELKGIIRQAKIDYLQHSVIQCKRFPKRAGYIWSCINAVIGRSKSHKSVIDDLVSLDSINDFDRLWLIPPSIRSRVLTLMYFQLVVLVIFHLTYYLF